MTKRQAKKVRKSRVSACWNRQATFDRAMLRLGGFVVDGAVYDEMRLLELRGQYRRSP